MLQTRGQRSSSVPREVLFDKDLRTVTEGDLQIEKS